MLSIIRNMVIVGPYSARLLHLPWWHFYRTAAISIASFAIASIITFFCQTLFPPTEWVSLLIAGITSCLLGWIVVGRVTFGKKSLRGLAHGCVVRFCSQPSFAYESRSTLNEEINYLSGSFVYM